MKLGWEKVLLILAVAALVITIAVKTEETDMATTSVTFSSDGQVTFTEVAGRPMGGSSIVCP